MAALAHAGDDHPAAAGADDGDGFGEIVDEIEIERGFERAQALRLELDGARGGGNRLARVVVGKTVAFETDSHTLVPPSVSVLL